MKCKVCSFEPKSDVKTFCPACGARWPKPEPVYVVVDEEPEPKPKKEKKK